MKSIALRFLAAGLALVMGTAIAQAQTSDDAAPPPPGMHERGFGRGGPMREFFSRALNLTDEQRAQMKDVAEKAETTIHPLRQQQRQLDLQIRQYVQGAFDERKVQAVATQKARLQAQITVAEARMHNAMYQLLTPEQQSRMKEMQAERAARMQRRTNDAPPPPPPAD